MYMFKGLPVPHRNQDLHSQDDLALQRTWSVFPKSSCPFCICSTDPTRNFLITLRVTSIAFGIPLWSPQEWSSSLLGLGKWLISVAQFPNLEATTRTSNTEIHNKCIQASEIAHYQQKRRLVYNYSLSTLVTHKWVPWTNFQLKWFQTVKHPTHLKQLVW